MQIGNSLAAALPQLPGAGSSRHSGGMGSECGCAGAVVPGTSHAVGGPAALRVASREVMAALGGSAETTGPSRTTPGYGPVDASGLGAVAKALRAALERAAPNGADPVPGLLAQIESGLANATAALARLGLADDAIESAIGEFRARVGGLIDASVGASAPVATSLTAVSAQQVRKERASLQLVTQDGDVVHIRYRSRAAERLDIAAMGSAGVTAVSAQAHSSSSAHLKLDVRGELDAGELAAIEDFLAQVDGLAKDFFAGDVEQAFATGAALKLDAGELAAFSIRLSVSERTSIRAVDQRPQTPAPRYPAAAVAAPAPVQAGTLTPASAADVSATGNAARASPQAAPAEAGAITPAAHTPPSVHDTIRSFVRRAVQAADAPLAIGRIEVGWAAKLRFVAEAIERAPPDAANTATRPGAVLLGDVLDRVATGARRAA